MAIRSGSVAAGARYLGLGVGLGGTVVAAIWLGDQVDQRFGTSPLFLLVFLVGALVGFMRRMMWMLEKWGPEKAEPPSSKEDSGE